MAATDASASSERARLTSLGGLVVVLASTVLSIASYAPLAETVRIHWKIGAYRHYGPEHAPTLFVLVVFPVIVTGLYVGARWLRNDLERSGDIEEFDGFLPIYDVCVLLTLGVVVVGQIVVIALNL